jgi:hypothetical protein
LKAFFEGFGVWTPVLKMCVWIKTLAAASFVSGKRQQTKMVVGFCSETQKTQCLKKLGFFTRVFMV